MDDELIEKMARALAAHDLADWDAAHFGLTPNGETPDEMREHYRDVATAALAAMREAMVPWMQEAEAMAVRLEGDASNLQREAMGIRPKRYSTIAALCSKRTNA